MTTEKPYRTLFLGTLAQESALSIGGREQKINVVDAPQCRDGDNRPTLRGAGLAGALVASLRRILGGDVPDFISGSRDGCRPSLWKTYHSHPHPDTQSEFRQHVAINAKTGAAENDMLFNVETLPAETAWPFLLEVDTADPVNGKEAERLAFATLREWRQGRCWLGREVARGMGWMHLEDLRVYQLDRRHLDRWPDSRYASEYPAYVRSCFGKLALKDEGLEIALKRSMPAQAEDAAWHLEIAASFHAGPRQDGYGLDSLSLGGHEADTLYANRAAPAFLAHFLKPEGMDREAWKKDFKPDFAFALTARHGEQQPYLPGSSLRGVFRHALERYYRAKTGAIPDSVNRAFGDTENSGSLLVRDAYLSSDNWRAALLQHHAEDEFAGGVYESSKFDRMALLEGRFGFRIHVEGRYQDKLIEIQREVVKPLIALAKAGRIPLGGNIWRGHGWGVWDFEEVYCGRTGEI